MFDDGESCFVFKICRSRIKEYLPIAGLVEFNKLSAKLILGADRYMFPD